MPFSPPSWDHVSSVSDMVKCTDSTLEDIYNNKVDQLSLVMYVREQKLVWQASSNPCQHGKKYMKW